MSFNFVVITLEVLIALCASLFVSVIYIKLTQVHRDKKTNTNMNRIRPILDELFVADTADFMRNHEFCISELHENLKGKFAQQNLEDVLLDILEDAEGETKERACIIASHFKFPEGCLSMIRDRLSGNVAIGCRKAGLYQYKGAIPDILKALGILSSNTQFQALMAMSRIGDAAALVEAFNKIHTLIFVNERAVNEILNTFSGDRLELYKNMLHHESDYLVRLFLKSIDKEMANALIEDIISISKSSGKETRLAGIIAVGKSGSSEKIPILIQALDDKEWEIRAMAAKTLGVLTSPDAVIPLANAACDREWWVRQNAVTSILAYPNREGILASIAQTGDRFAYDSMLYILGKADETELLSAVRDAWKAVSANQGSANQSSANQSSANAASTVNLGLTG